MLSYVPNNQRFGLADKFSAPTNQTATFRGRLSTHALIGTEGSHLGQYGPIH